MLIDLTTPVGAFGFEDDRAFSTRIRAEFERTAALNRRPGTFLRIEGGERDAVAAFRRNPYVEGVTPVVEGEERSLYRLRLGDARPPLLRALDDEDGTVLSAVIAGDRLSFEVRFPDHGAGSRFYAAYDDPANPISVRRSNQSDHLLGESVDGVTPKQRETLYRALETGYFEIPRKTSLMGLATDLGITDNAVSERLRRGTATLVQRWAGGR